MAVRPLFLGVDTVECAGCGVALEPQHGEERQPCPECGSTARVHHARFEATATAHLSLGYQLHRSGGRPSKPALRAWGGMVRQANGLWRKVKRVFDRELDWYEEEVSDPETGEVFNRCAEPLSEHRGHGSDKKKP